ncbi:MAG: ABC transporter permease [Eubacteriales bacterium]|nr:ABC transporter permease [Eubacteriales bacterium]
MFWRMIKGTVFRQRDKMFMIAFTVALGASLTTAMINVMFGVGDKVNAELKTYGANIRVMPQEASLLDDIYGIDKGEDDSVATAYLEESELPLIKSIFWGFNIKDYAPFLSARAELRDASGKALVENCRVNGTWLSKSMKLSSGEEVYTGLKSMRNWWQLEGDWPTEDESDAIMIGSELAERTGLSVGDEVELYEHGTAEKLRVKSIFHSGDDDDVIYAPLSVSQKLLGLEGKVEHIEVSALTTPDNDLARKAAQNPKSLTIKEWEAWYCTAYVSSISYQIQEVITNSVAKPLRQVAESEGAILNKTQTLMLLISLLSLLGSALGISNLVTASVMERSSEIGLMKAIGAQNASVVWVILCEIMLTGLLGGIVGYLVGLGFTQIIGYGVFGSAIPFSPHAIPMITFMVILVTILGSLPAIRYLLSLKPAEVLHGR